MIGTFHGLGGIRTQQGDRQSLLLTIHNIISNDAMPVKTSKKESENRSDVKPRFSLRRDVRENRFLNGLAGYLWDAILKKV